MRGRSTASEIYLVAGRALRGVWRDPGCILPALLMPAFYYVVLVGALEPAFERGASPAVSDYRGFQLPSALVFAVTGLSRAPRVVADIQSGYLDRLLLTPVRRRSLLLGMMAADALLMVMLVLPLIALGAVAGSAFATGLGGALLFVAAAAFYGVSTSCFAYAIAIRTGSATAVSSILILIVPVVCVTTTLAPTESMTPWFARLAELNPVTYVLELLRALVLEGWQTGPLLRGSLAIALTGLVGGYLAVHAMKRRTAWR
jgi:ABC-2 type transport system permease protein